MSALEEATEVKGQYGASQIQVLEGLEAVRYFRQGPAPFGV